MRTRLSRAEQVERNRELLLQAARHVFFERGYAGATLEAIAEEAGFSKGVVYSQFEGKADLFLTLLAQRIERRAVQNEQAVESLVGPDAVRALLDTARRDARADGRWALLLVEFRAHAARDPEIGRRYADSHARAVDRLAELLAYVHDAAGIVPAFSPQHIAEFVMGIGPAVALERAANPGALPPGVLEEMVLGAIGISRPV